MRATAGDSGQAEIAACLVRDPRPREPDQRAGHRRGDPPGTAHRQRRSGVRAAHDLTIAVGTAAVLATTGADGWASAIVTLEGPVGAPGVSATYAGGSGYAGDVATGAFTVEREDTLLGVTDAVATKSSAAVAVATLTEADGGAVTGATITFLAPVRAKKGATTWSVIGTATTDSAGVATFEVPAKYVGRQPTTLRASFDGDALFVGASSEFTSVRG